MNSCEQLSLTGLDALSSLFPEAENPETMDLEQLKEFVRIDSDQRVENLSNIPQDKEKRDHAKELLLNKVELILQTRGQIFPVAAHYIDGYEDTSTKVLGFKRVTPPVRISPTREILLGENGFVAVNREKIISTKYYVQILDEEKGSLLDDNGIAFVMGPEISARRNSFVSAERSNRANLEDLKHIINYAVLIERSLPPVSQQETPIFQHNQ
jgi:hypothetical protein